MLTIQTSLISSYTASFETQGKPHNHGAGAGNFDALLASFNMGANSDNSDPLYGFIEELLENITRSLNNNFSAKPLQAITPHTFGFTKAFDSAFGTSGPLPDFISIMTQKLHLNATQNQVLQDIAVRNKDITKTPESVKQIGIELQQAGIGFRVASSAQSALASR